MTLTKLYAPASPVERANNLMHAWLAAPSDTEVLVKSGHTDEGDPAILIIIDHDDENQHIFTASEARIVANLAEEALRRFPDDAQDQSIPELIVALRHGADEAERIRKQ